MDAKCRQKQRYQNPLIQPELPCEEAVATRRIKTLLDRGIIIHTHTNKLQNHAQLRKVRYNYPICQIRCRSQPCMPINCFKKECRKINLGPGSFLVDHILWRRKKKRILGDGGSQATRAGSLVTSSSITWGFRDIIL